MNLERFRELAAEIRAEADHFDMFAWHHIAMPEDTRREDRWKFSFSELSTIPFDKPWACGSAGCIAGHSIFVWPEAAAAIYDRAISEREARHLADYGTTNYVDRRVFVSDVATELLELTDYQADVLFDPHSDWWIVRMNDNLRITLEADFVADVLDDLADGRLTIPATNPEDDEAWEAEED